MTSLTFARTGGGGTSSTAGPIMFRDTVVSAWTLINPVAACHCIGGHRLRHIRFPLAPIAFAIVVGSVADRNLRRALVMFEGKSVWSILVDRPIGNLLMIVVLCIFYDGMFRYRD